MSGEIDSDNIWRSLGGALGVEIREAQTIRGASGQDHPVQAVGVDDKSKRIIIFSAEPSPRIAALMQIDVQITIEDARVVVARPVIFDLSEITRRFVANFGTIAPTVAQIVDDFQPKTKNKKRAEAHTQRFFSTKVGPALKPLFETAAKVRLPFVNQTMDVIGQLSTLDWPAHLRESPDLAGFINLFLSTVSLDSAEVDRKLGVCPIPMYEFSEQDYELLLSGNRIDEVRERLKALGIYQYFFPPADHLLLGLADNDIKLQGSLVRAAEEAPRYGHPIAPSEIFRDAATLGEVLEELKGRGYIAEGEIEEVITEEGKKIRQNLKIRPSESLFSKLSKLINVKVDISTKDFFKS
ncbi:MAG: hypothetical protein P4M07_12750 [Xanthobacteraceae bacterium]|nr:hypothetical protein [Xanthobacteraceae bacterium]